MNGMAQSLLDDAPGEERGLAAVRVGGKRTTGHFQSVDWALRPYGSREIRNPVFGWPCVKIKACGIMKKTGQIPLA